MGSVPLVNQIARALDDRPDLSPEPARITAASLRARQARAIIWDGVVGLLGKVLELASDHYLVEQGSVVEDALLVVRCFEAEQAAALSRSGPIDQDLFDKADLMAPVQQVLRRRELRMKQSSKRMLRLAAQGKLPVRRGSRRDSLAPLPYADWLRNNAAS